MSGAILFLFGGQRGGGGKEQGTEGQIFSDGQNTIFKIVFLFSKYKIVFYFVFLNTFFNVFYFVFSKYF